MSLTAGTATLSVDQTTGAVTASGSGMALAIGTAFAVSIEAGNPCPRTMPLPAGLPPPVPASQRRNIGGSTNASPIAIVSPAHGYPNGTKIVIDGHLVNTAANGAWTITVTGPDGFTLDGSTGNGVGVATGGFDFAPASPCPAPPGSAAWWVALPPTATWAEWWAANMLQSGIAVRTSAAPPFVVLANDLAAAIVAHITTNAVVVPTALVVAGGIVVGTGSVA